ncbi:MAG: GGDEF domain-containing protein [Ruminococcus sp.]|jgi:EAL domain-containing protein (putative c-di-GMP-specific phosphodiesterase class I)/GGDEF domain-containing protein|nr:GGDEF domain-containing protein [Ruminococcus sp.]
MNKNLRILAGAVLIVVLAALSVVFPEFALYFIIGVILLTVLFANFFIRTLMAQKDRAERYIAAINMIPDTGYITVNYLNGKVVASKNIASIAGVTRNIDELTPNDYAGIVKDLRSSPLSDEPNIYMSPVRNVWLKIKTLAAPSFDVCVLYDVSDYVKSLNVIKALKYYDLETNTLSKDAYNQKLGEAVNNNESTCGVMAFVIKGLDKVISFTGANEAAKIIVNIAEYLKSYENPHNTFIGRTSYNEFGVILTDTYGERCAKSARKILDGINEKLAVMKENSGKYIRIFCGYYSFSQEEKDINSIISAVDFAAFDAGQKNAVEPVEFSAEDFAHSATEFAKLQAFDEVINTNAVDYHFQPLVAASSGKILGYEALMRPRKIGGFRFSPTEMLKIAAKQERSYDIEKLTMFNTFKILADNADFFRDKKLFINVITSAMLQKHDYEKLLTDFSGLFGSAVLEVTENAYVTQENIDILSKRYRDFRAQIALDDYGSGYANGETLLQLHPQYVKIDRKLVANIDKDNKKQQLVSNTIEYARSQSIMTIAEGVEREEELNTMISLGVDYIQGFFTARPSPVFVKEIPVDIRRKIIDYQLNHCGETGKILEITAEVPEDSTYTYDADNDSFNVNLEESALMGYSQLNADVNKLTLTGDINSCPKFTVTVPADRKCEITLSTARFTAANLPCITLGQNSELTLILVGDNLLDTEGIRVPESASLKIIGDGNLEIRGTANNGISLGGNVSQDVGNIEISSKGIITIDSTGENTIAIGGGGSSNASIIMIKDTELKLNVQGQHCVGIGTFIGNSKITLDRCNISGTINGKQAVGIGTISGYSNIICGANVTLHCNGEETAVIGSLSGSENDTIIMRGEYKLSANGIEISLIGSVRGRTNISIKDGVIDCYAEGNFIAGIGDPFGSGELYIENGLIDSHMRSSMNIPIGIAKGRTVIAGGNIRADESKDSPVLYSPIDLPVEPQTVEKQGDFFRLISVGDRSYSYRAAPSPENTITAYLPINYSV